MDVVVGILLNGGVARVNVASLNGVALWISRVAPWRPEVKRGPQIATLNPRRDRQTGNQKQGV